MIAKNKKSSLDSDFKELEEITQKFENGEYDLEKGIPMFKKGLEVARRLKKRLNEIEIEIEEVKKEFKDLDSSKNYSPKEEPNIDTADNLK